MPETKEWKDKNFFEKLGFSIPQTNNYNMNWEDQEQYDDKVINSSVGGSVVTGERFKTNIVGGPTTAESMNFYQNLPGALEEKKSTTTTLPKERLKRTYRSRGGVLRYPFEALTEKTDYLQIDIVEYEPARKSEYNENNLLSRPGTRRIPSRSRVPGGLSTQSLVNKGTVLLQIPSQVQDSNAVNYGDSELNSLQGGLLQAGIDVPTAAGAKLAENPLNLVGGFQASGDAAKNAFKSAGLTVDGAKSLITKKLATSMVGALGGNVSVNQLLARSEGQILNPNMELLLSLIHI